jgi:hypothetical protein
MTVSWLSAEERRTRLLEAAVDIAYCAGTRRYHSGDSREDNQRIRAWAEEFERDVVNDENEWNYMTLIEGFACKKLYEVGG